MPVSSNYIYPQRLLEALPPRNKAVDAARMAELLKLPASQEPMLREQLKLFVQTGLASSKGGRFWKTRSTGTLIGTIRVTRSKHSFLIPDDPRERDRGDLFIGERRLGGALNGDKVIARIIGINERGREGRVEAVLHRANATLVGRLSRIGKFLAVVPIDDRILAEIGIGPSDAAGGSEGDIVNVEITRPGIAGQAPWGRVIEVLGRDDTPGIDIEVIIRKHRLPNLFSSQSIAQSESIPDQIEDAEVSKRVDLRQQLTVTIDGGTARDFDDAVSLEALPDGRYVLSVHIADVSHYVTEGSPLDDESMTRGTSVYFPERAIPMLPERLSNGICSLNPDVDRLTMSAIMQLDKFGQVVNYQLTPSIIRSSARLTYTEVNQIIEQQKSPQRDPAIIEMILQMHDLTQVLIKLREERCAIDFDLPEAEVLFNDEGQIGGIVRSERNIAHRLIEEFMLMANETVARHMEDLGVPTLFRIHEEPNIIKVEEFAEIAAALGHPFSMHGPVPQRGFQQLAQSIRGSAEERMLSYLMLRSMQRARYSAQNLGHFGLAMKTYTHFTSPIRRYPDLIVHRILKEVLGSSSEEQQWLDLGKKHSIRKVGGAILDSERELELRSSLDWIAEHSSDRERGAAAAEQDLMDWRKAEFMAQRVGDEFEGIITSVKDFGFYVELNEIFVEGLVHISTLTDDEYEYRERKHLLIGTRSGRTYRLGDPIRVVVNRVDGVRHLIDFSPS